ncbi:MAG: WbqC family protein [Bacteroidota bacterium]
MQNDRRETGPMKVAVMQPYFFPYLGYFQLIAAADRFVLYDDVNFIKRGWVNRNRVLIDGKEHLLTLPCRKLSQNKLINQIEVDLDAASRAKMLKLFEHAYKKAPMFTEVFGLLTHTFEQSETNLAGFLHHSIRDICAYLGINTPIVLSSEVHSGSRGMEKAERLVQIAKSEGADEYINAAGGKELYRKEFFLERGVSLHFLETRFREYPQSAESFIPGLSIIDVMMHNPKDAVNALLAEYSLS